MRRYAALAALAFLLLGPLVVGLAAVNNPLANAVPLIQGPDATGNSGYPFAVVQATGSTWTTASSTETTGTPGDAFANPGPIVQNQSFPEIFNGTTWDRVRTANASDTTAGVGLLGLGGLVYSNTAGTWGRWSTPEGDSQGQQRIANTAPMLFNGAGWDRPRSVGIGDAGSTGIFASGSYIFNGTTWDRIRSVGIGDAATVGLQAEGIYGWNGTAWDRLHTSAFADADTGAHLAVISGLWNGGSFDRPRGANIFKTATATAAGSTAVWTPAATARFRLMRFYIQVTGDAKQAVAGDLTIQLLDAAAAIGEKFVVFVPATSINTDGNLWQSPWIDLQNGIVSAAANNVLNVNLSAALTSGTVSVIACGTEE